MEFILEYLLHFTDVTTKQFGEGSLIKEFFFNIPIYGNLVNYTWRPLTKDPGANLIEDILCMVC